MAENNNDQNNKLTVYQKLNQTLNLDGFGFNSNDLQNANPTFASHYDTQRAKIIIKGDSPQDVYRKGLELQQKQELVNKFFKSSERSFQKSMQYEAARLPAYIDYEGMEYYPLIASALDLYMEESTTIGMNGKMLNIYSNKERIKLHLEELFNDIMNINVNLPFWTRNTAKYGDNFLILFGENKKGITNVKQMVNYEVERIERVHDGKPNIKFKERITGNDFNIFEIAHFRLLGDDKFIPYGTSCLSKVRRVFRQLCLDSNANVWTPNGYTKIKDLKIGDDIYSFDYSNDKLITTKVKNVFKTGEKERFKIKTRHRELILTNDHPLLTNDNIDFKYQNINEIIDENLILPTVHNGLNSFKIKMNAKDYYVLLNESGKNKIKNIPSIGIITMLRQLNCETTIKNLHCFIKGYNRGIRYDDYIKLTKIFNLTLDDIDLHYFNSRKKAIVNKNLEFIVNENFIQFFGFMLGDGWINESNKCVGFALGVYEDENKFYIDLCKSFGDFNHLIKDRDNKGNQVNFYSIELKNILEKLEFKTGAFNKIIPKWVFSLSYENKMKFIKGIFDADGCDNFNSYSSSNYKLIYDLRILAQTCNIKVGKICNDLRTETFFNVNNEKIISKRQPSYKLYMKISDIVEPFIKEKIIYRENVGIGEVWDLETESDLHNFIADGIVVHNCLAEDAMLTYRIIRAGEKKVFKIDVGNIDNDDVDEYIAKVASAFKKSPQIDTNNGQIDYRFNILGNDEDYFLPVRNGNSGTGIDTLPGAQNLSEIADIEYLRDNLFVSLGIPKPFLNFQDAAGAGKNMAQFDMRFAKKIARIQQAMIQELNKIAIIHLTYLGFDSEDLGNFTLTLNNPSTQQELLKTDLLNQKAQAYSNLTKVDNGIAAMSHTEAQKIVFNKSDHEIINGLKQQRMERAIMQELQDTPLIIKNTTVFDDIDKKYGEGEGMIGSTPEVSGGTETTMSSGGGSPIVSPETPQIPGGEFQKPSELPPVEGEGFRHRKSMMSEKTYNSILDNLVNDGKSNNNINKVIQNKKILKENELRNRKLNEEASDMISEINKLLEEPEKSGELLKRFDKLEFDFDKIRINEIKDNTNDDNEVKE